MCGQRNSLTLRAVVTIVALWSVHLDSVAASAVLEEVVVEGTRHCGSWPIDHERMSVCEFAVLKPKVLPKILEVRPRLYSHCLSCSGTVCTPRSFRTDQQTEARLCQRVFWTPTRIADSMNFSRNNKPVGVSITYTISTAGRPENIQIRSLEGKMARRAVLQLIEQGAARTRFEPLIIDGTAYEIVDLVDSFVLGDIY